MITWNQLNKKIQDMTDEERDSPVYGLRPEVEDESIHDVMNFETSDEENYLDSPRHYLIFDESPEGKAYRRGE